MMVSSVLLISGICLFATPLLAKAQIPSDFASRKKDPALGPIVYELWVDRFAPPSNPVTAAKRFEAPRTFHAWTESAKNGHFDAAAGYWSHELDFWGGDLTGLRSKLPYLKELGIDVLYLRPVFEAFSNHKYDTTDYLRVDPELGTNADLESLFHDCHQREIKVVLDGVFNHVGLRFKPFRDAQNGGPTRSWFTFDKKYPHGYLSFAGVPSLPSLKLETPEVRRYLWNGKDSVVRHWLNKGADGWRLDVAYELGPKYLSELTQSAHQEKPGSVVVGEIRGYPADWFPAVDGVFNFYALTLAKRMLAGDLSGGAVGTLYGDMVADAPYENLLKSWLVADNGDTGRLSSEVSNFEDRKLVEALQFTLPGSPMIYYGTELGMQGKSDIEARSPMRWDLATKENQDLKWIKTLSRLRKRMPSLRIGDFKPLRTNELLAFVRYTDKLREAIVVVVNPTDHEVTETFGTRIGRAMSWATYRDALSGRTLMSIDGTFHPKMPPKSVAIYSVVVPAGSPYDPHRRID